MVKLFSETFTARMSKYADKLTRKEKPLTPEGDEILDSTPMQPPVGFKRQPTLTEQIRAMVQSERLAQEARAMGMETFEESEDFDVEDGDPDPGSPWENDYEPSIQELIAAGRESLETKKAAASPPGPAPASPSPQPPPSDDPLKV